MSKHTRTASSSSERYTLYLHLCHVTGRGYVGWTTYDVETRWNWHVIAAKGGSALRFHQAIRKHGEMRWEHINLMTVNDRANANLLERHFVTVFDTYHDGYNMTPGGDGRGRFKHSGETRAKMRQHVKTPEHRQHLSESMKGQRRVPLSEEHRRKISESERGEKHYRFGQKLSDDVKRKIADKLKSVVPKNKGVKLTDEQYFRRWGRHRASCLRNADDHATVLGTGIQHQLKPGGPQGIEGSTPSSGTRKLVVHCKKEPFDVYIGRPSHRGGTHSVTSLRAGQRSRWTAEKKPSHTQPIRTFPSLPSTSSTPTVGTTRRCATL